jgi:hypothetical protein
MKAYYTKEVRDQEIKVIENKLSKLKDTNVWGDYVWYLKVCLNQTKSNLVDDDDGQTKLF